MSSLVRSPSPFGHDTLDGDGEAQTDAEPEPAVGTVIGRYVVVDRLGAGAMGVVYSAYDPELDRKVAIKLLHPHGDRGGEGRARLVREAQALAKLSHPNVVGVHDAGTIERRVWVAMEFVAGATLGAWLRADERSWSEIVAVLSAAGHGLAAAHKVGLVHRDFKPENVMVGDDGRVRVMDFGLARSGSAPVPEPKSGPDDVAGARPEITRGGTLLGTPAYMAPEQHAGLPADAKSDQFSFCVALWEALCRERPFDGSTVIELATNVLSGQMRAPPGNAHVPAWLRRTVQRGLAKDPAARWPSMDDLLAALERGRARARLRRPIAAAFVVVAIVGSIVGIDRFRERSRVRACENEGGAIEDVWNASARDRVRAALAGAHVVDAELIADKAVAVLDDDAATWQSARSEACLDASVRGVWSADMLERSVWCFDDKRSELAATVETLAGADDEVARSALQGLANRTPIAGCRDADLLARVPRPPEAEVAAVRERRNALSRIIAAYHGGRSNEALGPAREELERAVALGWLPLTADARLAVGQILEDLGRYEEAESALEETYFEAVRAGEIDTAATATSALAFTVGARLARHREGLRWARQGLLLLESVHREESTRAADILAGQTAIEYAMGEFAAAKATAEHVLAIREAEVGPDHPDIAIAFVYLANCEQALGESERARDLYLRALAIQEEALGPSHVDFILTLVNLATADRTMKRFDEAESLFRRALAIEEATLGPDHPDIALTLNNLAALSTDRGDYAHANETLERAIAIAEKALGPDHPDVALMLANLAENLHSIGDLERAERMDERAITIIERSLGPSHFELAHPLQGLATIELERGRAKEAAVLARRALALHEATDPESAEALFARFLFARAEWERGGDRTRALELARAARASAIEKDPALADGIAEWLRVRDVKTARTDSSSRARDPSPP